MDRIFDDISAMIGGFLGSAPVQFAFQAIAVYFVILWLAAAYWAYRDMQLRSENPILPYVAATLIILFTPVFFPLAIFVYRIVRPQERIGEVYERTVAEEALQAEIDAVRSCPTCARRIEDEWVICPTCRTRLNRVCPNCSRLVGLGWSLCAWCGRDFERREAPAMQPLRERDEIAWLGGRTVQPGSPAAAPSLARAATQRSSVRPAQEPMPER